MRESDIEQYLVDKVEARGGETRKVQWVGRSKAPDRVVMLPFRSERMAAALKHFKLPTDHLKSRTIWVELKTPGGLAAFPKNAHERAQHREHERMRALGQHVVVIDSKEGVDALLA